MSDQLPSDRVFLVGEVVILCNFKKKPERNGDEAVIQHLPRPYEWIDPADGKSVSAGNYVTFHHGESHQTQPQLIRKKRPPAREDYQLTTWDKCLWQPRQVNA